jgi:hypothetical protein
MSSKAIRLALLCTLALAGCASAPRAYGPPRVPPAQLRSVEALPYDLLWRQRVTARWPKGKQRFDAVLQKQHGTLLLMGLSAFGQPGFIVRLDPAGQVTLENRTGEELPFDLQYVLVDVQRVFYPWLAEPAPSDGERWGVQGDSRVWERYAHGVLVGRVFARDTQQGIERVTVRYQPSAAPADAPARVVLDNPLLRYSLTIETLEQQRLTTP